MSSFLIILAMTTSVVVCFGMTAQFCARLRPWTSLVLLSAVTLNVEALVQSGVTIPMTTFGVLVCLFALLFAAGCAAACYVLGRALPWLVFARRTS